MSVKTQILDRLSYLLSLIKQFFNLNILGRSACVCGSSVDVVTETTTPVYEYKRAYILCNNSLDVQSSDAVDTHVDTSGTTSEVLTFADSMSIATQLPYNKNPLISSGATGSSDLGTFLSRPTLIDTLTWTTSDTVSRKRQIEPWHLFLNNSIIKDKIKNYAYLRAKLCIKVVANGTPFHFGMMCCAYEPNVNVANTGDRISKIRSNPYYDYPLLVSYSQLPCTYIYPQKNTGGELHLPFFKAESWLRLRDAAQAKTMGVLTYFIAVPLAVASATASSTITLQTYAWLEDVELSGPTNELVLQSSDEYDGIISAPASALASISKRLEGIPSISKFARATTIGATAAAKISSIFGFTNVPVISEHKPMVPQPNSSISTSEISTPVHKLTLDPKQELSIDPSLHGMDGKDEMVIKHIISRPAIFHVFDWNTTDLVGKVIMNSRVTPALYDTAPIYHTTTSAVVANRVYHTYLSYLNHMFTHWRGDIIFDFEVICTKFHKGRLQISWDPTANTSSTPFPPNSVYTVILDIGETNRCKLRVPFHAYTEWCRFRGVSQYENFTTGANLNAVSGVDNGIIQISVLTPLISPVTPQETHIVARIYAADNFEFANPRSTLAADENAEYPSYFAVQSQDVDEVELDAVEIPFGDNGSKHEHRYDMNFGERIVSLRSLMRRYSLHSTVYYPTSNLLGSLKDTRTARYVYSLSRLPPSSGFHSTGTTLAFSITGTGSYYYFNNPTTPLLYIAMLYGGYRGGTNFIINTDDGLSSTTIDTRVQRITESTFPTFKQPSVPKSSNSSDWAVASAIWNQALPVANAGATFTNTRTNGTISCYFPHMSRFAFSYPDPSKYKNGNSADETDEECLLIETNVKGNGLQTTPTLNATLSTTVYTAAGTDFTCIWLLCPPTIDYALVQPTVTGSA